MTQYDAKIRLYNVKVYMLHDRLMVLNENANIKGIRKLMFSLKGKKVEIIVKQLT